MNNDAKTAEATYKLETGEFMGEAIAKAYIMLSKPDYDPSEVVRHITLEIATVSTRAMNDQEFMVYGSGLKTSTYLRILRELRQSVIDTEAMKQRGTLDLVRGHLLSKTVEHFRRAMAQAGIEDFLVRLVLSRYREIAEKDESNLRRELAELGRLKASGR